MPGDAPGTLTINGSLQGNGTLVFGRETGLASPGTPT